MEAKNDWVITITGQIRRRDRLKPNDKVEDFIYKCMDNDRDKDQMLKNSFETKEDAYFTRDEIIDYNPTAFLPEQKPSQQPNGKKKDVSIDEFRSLTKQQVIQHLDIFWNDWLKLRPKDKCDVFIKVLSFAFPHAPAEKAPDEDEKQRVIDNKNAITTKLIESGLDDFDDDDTDDEQIEGVCLIH